MIAALFVATGGCYFGLPHVDPWDEARDARKYDGPHAVVAHPPCSRWGCFAESAFGKPTGVLGDDGGCFRAALSAVRRWGGVIEHPRGSRAWAAFGLKHPREKGGWSVADGVGGFTCRVDQKHYGHRSAKPTWLYAFGVPTLPALEWSRAMRSRSIAKPEDHRRMENSDYAHLGRRERAATPLAFRNLLLSIAASASSQRRST